MQWICLRKMARTVIGHVPKSTALDSEGSRLDVRIKLTRPQRSFWIEVNDNPEETGRAIEIQEIH
jgi:hypothetical protein